MPVGDVVAGRRSSGDRAERLRKDLADLDAEVARLEVAEVVFGQFADAQRAGCTDDPETATELERVTGAPGAGGMPLVPHHKQGLDTSALPADYQPLTKGWRRRSARRRPRAHPPRTGDENRPNYSGKHKAHGLLFLALR